MANQIIANLCEVHIRGTAKKAAVQLVTVFLCHLTFAVSKGLRCDCNKVYVSTRALKHCYDKRTAEEFDFLTKSIHKVIQYPDKIFTNKPGKRGEYCFYKEIKNSKYFCSIEKNERDDGQFVFEIVTFFRVQDSYIKSYELLWEWKGGESSS